MGQCLRGKMVGAGILPAPATAMVDPTVAPGEPAAITAEPEVGVAEPALDVTAPADADVPENLIAATFGLLRAEPDGSVVIAGSGTPGSEVEIYSNGALLGKTTVESSGDWVLVPEAPIPPGGTEITLGEAGKTGLADQSFVVAINEDKTSEPLVVASTIGAASQVLQGLGAPAGTEPMQTAAADPVVPPEAATATPAPTETAAAAEVPAATAAEPATDEPVVTAEAPAADTPEPATAEPETAAEPPSEAPAVASEPAVAAAAEPATLAVEPATSIAEPAEPAATPAAGVETAVAAVEPTQVSPAVVLDSTPPTIDAIEIEGDKTFFAGGGPEGAALRLYVDDQFVADTTVADGRWLVEAGDVLTKPSQRIRIDVLQPDSAKVASRAEVNFVVDLPGDDAPVAVAQAETSVIATPEVPPVAEPAPEPAASVEPATATSAPTEPAPAASEPAVVPEPAAAPEPAPAEPAPAVEPPASAEAPAAQSAPAVETLPATTPAQPAEPVLADTTPAAEPPAPASEAPPAAASDVPTLVAVAVGDPDAARFASGKAIIRRGDNLWTIARRVYGEGIKYTTIYQANTGQIRDPDRIYPGQVFDLPEGATN